MSDSAAGAALGAGSAPHRATYTPLVPTFSPFTSDAATTVRLAWRITYAAFLTLVVLAVGIPIAWRWYLGSAIEPQVARFSSIDGEVFLLRGGAHDWIVAKGEDVARPGDSLRTAGNARAFIRLSDQSTVLLYPSSTLTVLRAERGRFRTERTTNVLDLSQGRARIGVASLGNPSETFFQLRTPNAQVHLDPGSYAADVAKETSQVVVRVGSATAYTKAGVANALTGQRLIAEGDHLPLGNQPARRDLIQNGLFAERTNDILAGWTVRALSERDPPGTVSPASIPGALTFQRDGVGHGENLITQQVDVDLWDFERVTLSANVRVLQHSLSGGGWQGTEYPIMLRVFYRDETGGVQAWYHGFYVQNDDGYPTRDAEQLPDTDWHHVDIDLLSLAPRPWRIQRVEVVATGWAYTSAVNEVHVWAE